MRRGQARARTWFGKCDALPPGLKTWPLCYRPVGPGPAAPSSFHTAGRPRWGVSAVAGANIQAPEMRSWCSMVDEGWLQELPNFRAACLGGGQGDDGQGIPCPGELHLGIADCAIANLARGHAAPACELRSRGLAPTCVLWVFNSHRGLVSRALNAP